MMSVKQKMLVLLWFSRDMRGGILTEPSSTNGRELKRESFGPSAALFLTGSCWEESESAVCETPVPDRF
jgi:hypothetical protein